ncbi:MAG: hypothetical protein HQL94_03345 [Magnetococcales bacterium]|nr:hypothetical protein [Magnetococcales bacterium]MBF0438159.1 hypothetical protein [Magnetococcales bacterium]
MDSFSDSPTDRESPPPLWDCRWPDPVALQVSATRILRDLPADDPAINRRLAITVTMENGPNGLLQALLVTPWAVERIYWHNPATGSNPPIRHAISLEQDSSGHVSSGQGVLFEAGENRLVPVVIAWEPETGHYFVETLLHCTQEFDTSPAALAAALGEPLTNPPQNSLTSAMNLKVSRRKLLGFWRRS